MILKYFKHKISSLLLVTFLDHLSINIVMPVLVFVFFDKTSTLFDTETTVATRSYYYGIATSLPYFAAMFTTPFLSALSDQYGRKLMLIIASLGALFFSICCGFSVLSGAIAIMLIGKFTGGLCARSEPTALAAIADLSDPQQKTIHIGYLQAVIALGAFIGPVIGGYATKFHFDTLNFSAAFWLAAIIALFSTITAIFMFQETSTPNTKTNQISLKEVYKSLWSTEIRKLALILILFQIAWSMYYQFFPPVLKQYFNYTPQTVGWFIGLIALWLTITTLIGMRILKKYFSDLQILPLSIYAMLLGFTLTFLGLINPGNTICQILVWAGAVFIPVGDVAAYCVIVALLSEAVNNFQQGKVMGLCFLLVYVAWGCTSLVAGYLGGIHITLPILLAPLALIISLNKFRGSGIKL